MASLDFGKTHVTAWARTIFPYGSTCLDVGACDGKWHSLLGNHFVMDAVEIFEPNIEKHDLKLKYRNVYCADIADFTYDWYDLIVLGDVLEHMTVEQAQKVIEYAKPRCMDLLIVVPFNWHQDETYGNKWEKHVQDDLTPELFEKRYHGLMQLSRPLPNYAYYVKEMPGFVRDGGAKA